MTSYLSVALESYNFFSSTNSLSPGEVSLLVLLCVVKVGETGKFTTRTYLYEGNDLGEKENT